MSTSGPAPSRQANVQDLLLARRRGAAALKADMDALETSLVARGYKKCLEEFLTPEELNDARVKILNGDGKWEGLVLYIGNDGSRVALTTTGKLKQNDVTGTRLIGELKPDKPFHMSTTLMKDVTDRVFPPYLELSESPLLNLVYFICLRYLVGREKDPARYNMSYSKLDMDRLEEAFNLLKEFTHTLALDSVSKAYKAVIMNCSDELWNDLPQSIEEASYKRTSFINRFPRLRITIATKPGATMFAKLRSPDETDIRSPPMEIIIRRPDQELEIFSPSEKDCVPFNDFKPESSFRQAFARSHANPSQPQQESQQNYSPRRIWALVYALVKWFQILYCKEQGGRHRVPVLYTFLVDLANAVGHHESNVTERNEDEIARRETTSKRRVDLSDDEEHEAKIKRRYSVQLRTTAKNDASGATASKQKSTAESTRGESTSAVDGNEAQPGLAGKETSMQKSTPSGTRTTTNNEASSGPSLAGKEKIKQKPTPSSTHDASKSTDDKNKAPTSIREEEKSQTENKSPETLQKAHQLPMRGPRHPSPDVAPPNSPGQATAVGESLFAEEATLDDTDISEGEISDTPDNDANTSKNNDADVTMLDILDNDNNDNTTGQLRSAEQVNDSGEGAMLDNTLDGNNNNNNNNSSTTSQLSSAELVNRSDRLFSSLNDRVGSLAEALEAIREDMQRGGGLLEELKRRFE